MYKVLLLLLACFTTFLFSADSEKSSLRPQYANIFNSSIYSEFHAQLEAFLEQQLKKHPQLDLSQLRTNTLTSESHYALVTNLRDHLSRNNDEELQGFLDDFTEFLYTGINIESSTKAFLAQEGIDASLMQTFFQKSPSAHISQLHRHIVDHKKSIKAIYDLDDRYLRGDLPSKLFVIEGSKPIQMVRLPGVVMELEPAKRGEAPQPKIVPEFRNYLRVLSRKNKTHLYMNALTREGSEKIKAAEVENLENDLEAQNSLVVVTLDKDGHSPFYSQSGKYRKLDNAELFKGKFLEVLLEPQGRYYWSKKLDLAYWKSQLEEIIKNVHQTYFHSADTLNQKERLDFIELAYVHIIEALIEKFQPDNMNITCKQSLDRGPSLYSLFYYYQKHKKGYLTDEEQLQFLYFIFSPPLAYNNRSAQEHIILRLEGAVNRIAAPL